MMTPKWPTDDASVFIGWYEYTVDGVRYQVDPRDIVHFRNGMNAGDQGRTGVDELASLWAEIFTDDEAARFTAALLQNLGVPGVVIAPSNTTSGPGRVLRADPEAVKKKFMDSFEGDKRGEPLVFTTPTDVKVLSWNPQQLDLKSLRRVPEERVSARLGVPAGVAGLGAGLDRNTFSNLGEANVSAYTQGVIPRQREIAADLEVQLLPDFVADAIETYDVFFDASVTAAMQALAAEIWKRAGDHATKGLITRAAYKRLTGQKVAEDGSDDVYIRPNNFLEIHTMGSGGARSTPRPDPSGPAQLPAGQQAVALLGPGAGEVRCGTCADRGFKTILAELASPPYRFTCRKCKAVTESEPAAA
jgi:phage portal protein BeeE